MQLVRLSDTLPGRGAACAAVAVLLALPTEIAAQGVDGAGMACHQPLDALARKGRVARQGVTFDFNRSTLRPDTLTPAAAGHDAGAAASLSFPMVVAPGERIPVTCTGPLNGGDWVDFIIPGNDRDMSGGWSGPMSKGRP